MNKEGNSSNNSSDDITNDNPEISEISNTQVGGDEWDKVNISVNTSSLCDNVDSNEQQNSSENVDSFVVVESSEEREESHDNKFTIIVRPLNGRDLTVTASPSSTIRQLKVLIEVKSGIEAINQRLIFRGRCMLDDDTVGTYIKENGVIIHLVPYVRNQTNDNAQTSTGSRARAPVGSNSSSNFQNLFSGVSGLNSSINGFPGAMMFGAIRLDGETGIPLEAEDLMQRVLRSFGEAVANSNVDSNIGETPTANGDLRNLNTINLNTFGFGQPSVISTLSGSNSNNDGNDGNSGDNRVSGSNESRSRNTDLNNSQINSSNSNTQQSNVNNSDQSVSNTVNNQSTSTASSNSGNIGVNNGNTSGNIRSEHMNSNPIGRIGTIVSRIFQAFNQPVADIIRENNVSERRRINHSTGVETNSNANTHILNSSIPTVSTERVISGSNSRRMSENSSQDSSTRVHTNPSSALNWTQLTTSGALTGNRTGLLPIGRPGLAVATIPISNLSIPITIRTTSSTGIPTINLSSGSNTNSNTNEIGNRSTEGVLNTNNTNINSTIRTSTSVDNNNLNSSNSTQVGELYRLSSESFFRNISNILEDSASQLQIVASSIREMSGVNDSNNNNGRENSAYLPPIPSSVTRNISTLNNTAFGNVSDYIQHHSHRLYISNELVHQFLPWDSLNELLNILERDSGWRRPRITIPPPIDSTDVGPLAVFISVFLQAMSMLQVNLMQIQAWQERFARLDVPRLCYTVHLLALISHISAHLSSLLAWLFHNMAQYVEQDRLLESLQWNRVTNDLTKDNGSVRNECDNAEGNNSEIIRTQDDDNMVIDDSNKEETRDHIVRLMDDSDMPETEKLNSSEREDKRIKRNVEFKEVEINGVVDDNEINQQTVINHLPQEVKEKWENWTGNPQKFSKSIFASLSTRSFSDTYQRGDVFATASRFGFSRSSNSTNDDTNDQLNNQPTSQDLFRMIIHQTEANLNINPSYTRNYNNLQNEYRAMLIRDLVGYVRNDSDFINDQDRFPYLQKIFSILYNNSSN